MKLIFSKEESDELNIEIVKGTTTEQFTYIGMVKELINENEIEPSIFKGDISEEEQTKIQDMLVKISNSISEEETE